MLAVIVFHHYLVGGHEVGWAPGGFLGVEVFFVVSGYLITSLLLSERRETGRVSLQRFYLRRARRLLPALYVLLAVVVAYSLAVPARRDRRRCERRTRRAHLHQQLVADRRAPLLLRRRPAGPNC